MENHRGMEEKQRVATVNLMKALALFLIERFEDEGHIAIEASAYHGGRLRLS